MKTEQFDVNLLTLDPGNARDHPDENLTAIKRSLKRFGQQKPILISRDNVVIAGNGTLVAAKAIGIDRIWATRSELSADEWRAYAIADNRTAELASWNQMVLGNTLTALKTANWDLADIGFPDFELPNDPAPGDGNEDEVPEQVEARTKPGDLYQLGDHRLLCGDSTKPEDVEKLMGGEKADLWCTDPPYGVSYQAKVEAQGRTAASKIENDDLPLDQMAVFWEKIACNAMLVTSDKASYYWFACQGGDQMMMMMMSISRAGWKVRHELIWVKDALVLGRCDYHYKHEPILYGWKQEGTHKFYGDRSQTSTIEFPRPRQNDLHPTMKPVELISYLIGNSSAHGERILETCAGSGTAFIACEKTGRRCFGMEIDPHYCDVIVSRWEKYTGKSAALMAGEGSSNA